MQLNQTNYFIKGLPSEIYDAHSAGGIVINHKNEVLLVEQGGVSWSFPKGHLEENESALEAAKREIFEETGISDLILIKELPSYIRSSNYHSPEGIVVVKKKITLFVFETAQEKLLPADSLISKVQWVNKDIVTDMLTHYSDEEFYTRLGI